MERREISGVGDYSNMKQESLVPRQHKINTHLLPQGGLGRQAGRGCHHPAVPQTALVQVPRAEAIHKQTGVLTQLLGGETPTERERERLLFKATYSSFRCTLIQSLDRGGLTRFCGQAALIPDIWVWNKAMQLSE